MWNKVSLRIKITILTTLALSLVTACITYLSIHNAQQHIVEPFAAFYVTVIERMFDSEDLATGALDGNGFRLYEIGRAMPDIRIIDPNHFFSQTPFVTIDQSQQNFQIYSIIIAIIFVLIGAIGAYLISGQALKPIKTLATDIENIDANNLATKIEPPASNDEVSRLTHSFNNMLEKLNSSFETQKLFAQNAAHELKTPLASIRTNIEVLQLDSEPSLDEYKEVVNTVKGSTEQLIALVDGLLALNDEVDESKWQFFYGKEMFEKILSDLNESIAEKELEVLLLGNCRVKGNQSLLERAFSNLVHNAIRYNIKGGLVRIIMTNDSIIIEDSGIGIPREHLTHLFEPFYCVNSSRSKELGGNGLGLAIAKHIFDKHKFEITVSSEIGVGTTIILSKI